MNMSFKHRLLGFVLVVLVSTLCAGLLPARASAQDVAATTPESSSSTDVETTEPVGDAASQVQAGTDDRAATTQEPTSAVSTGTTATSTTSSTGDASEQQKTPDTASSTAATNDVATGTSTAGAAADTSTDTVATGTTVATSTTSTTSTTSGLSTSVATDAVATATTPETTVVTDQSSGQVVADGIYTIASGVSSTKVLEVRDGSTSNGGAVQIYDSNSTPAQRWQLTYVGNGYYTLKNLKSGLCLDVPGAEAVSEKMLQQYTGNGTDAQLWQLVDMGNGQYSLVSKVSSNLAVDVQGGSSQDGTSVWLYEVNRSAAQLWSFLSPDVGIAEGVYTIGHSGTNQVVDISNGSLVGTANVQQCVSNSTYAQYYRITYDASDGYYRVANIKSGLLLDVAEGSPYAGANVWQIASNGTNAQKWCIQRNADGTYSLFSALSGKALDVAGNSSSTGANVQVYYANGSSAQKWVLTSLDNWFADGVYQIVAANNRENDVSIVSSAIGSTSDNVLTASRLLNSANQKWAVVSTGDGYYMITNLNMRKALAVDGTAARSGVNVLLADRDATSASQLWKLVVATGGFKLVSKLSDGYVMDIYGNGMSANSNVQLYASNDTIAQRFLFATADVLSELSHYTLLVGDENGNAIDVYDGSVADGATIWLHEYNDTLAQYYRIEDVGDGTSRIANVKSGKYLTVDGDGIVQRSQDGSAAQRWIISFDLKDCLFLIKSAMDGTFLAGSGTTLGLADSSSDSQSMFSLHAQPSQLNGVDIASYESGIDLSLLPADFVIVKSTQGTTYTNPEYAGWASTLLNLGRMIGVYHYATGEGAEAEANAFVASLNTMGLVGKALLALDWEDTQNVLFGTASAVSYCLTFLNRVYALTGVKPVIYMSKSVCRGNDWSSVVNAGYGLWFAQYASDAAYNDYVEDPWTDSYGNGAWGSSTMYQYTSNGHLLGFSGSLDLDIFYGGSSLWTYYAGRR